MKFRVLVFDIFMSFGNLFECFRLFFWLLVDFLVFELVVFLILVKGYFG